MYTPDYERYKHPLEEYQTVSPAEMETDMVIPSSLYEDFPYKYYGSLGSMEYRGMMWMIKRLYTVMGECV